MEPRLLKYVPDTHDEDLIQSILVRAMRSLGYDPDAVRLLATDLAVCHLNGCPLALDKLLAARIEDFEHDVFGITKYLDRSTGQLTNLFVPRYALSEQGGSNG